MGLLHIIYNIGQIYPYFNNLNKNITMLQRQPKTKLSKQEQQRLRLRDLAFTNADNLILDLQSRLQPISLAYIAPQLPPMMNNNNNESVSYPGAGGMGDSLRFIDGRAPEYALDVEVLKRVKPLKIDRVTFEKGRELREGVVDPKAKEEHLKRLQQIDISNSELRMLLLTENSLKPVKYLQHLSLQDYQHFIIQTYGQCQMAQGRMIQVINQIKRLKPERKEGFLESILMRFSKQDKNAPIMTPEQEKKIADIIDAGFLLGYSWHFNENFPVRLIGIHKNWEIQQGHFFAYIREYPAEMQNPNEPLALQTAQSLKNKLLFAYVAGKNRQRIQKLSQGYMQNTKASINNQLIMKNLAQNFLQPPQKQYTLTQKQKILNEYASQNIQNFMDRWRQKSLEYHKNSKLYFYIQPTEIHIPKTHFAKDVNLTINSQVNQIFVYSGQDQRSFIFAARGKKTQAFLLESLRNMDFQFLASIRDEAGRTDQFRNKINLSEIQNQGLGFSYELGLIPDNLSLIANNVQGDFPYVLVFEAAVKRAASFQVPEDLRLYRQVNLLTKVGKIPNIYSSFYKYDYTPQIHPLVSQILNGVPSQINEKNFEETYIDFVNFFQHQENKSQNYCEYLKLKKIKQTDSSGFVMRDRYARYCQFMAEDLQKVRKGYPQIFSGHANINKHTIKRQIANLSEDIKGQQPGSSTKIHHLLQRYIIYQCLKNRQNQKIGSHVSMVSIADKIITIYQKSEHNVNRSRQSLDMNQLSIFFIAFMEAMYPYNSYKTLRDDLIQIRLLAQKNIPQFNYLLNRKGIGLENYASGHLLEMFSSLPAELCFRIWDLMVASTNRVQQTRIFTLYTLMLHQQKSNLLPIYPINQIIESIRLNSLRLKLDNSNYYNMSKLVENYAGSRMQRQRKITELAKHKYLRKFVYGTVEVNIAQDEEDFPRAAEQVNKQAAERIHTKLMSLREVKYPLPSPGFQGYEIHKIYLFISGIFLLNNINLHSKKFQLQINVIGGSELAQIEITDKSAFQNRFIEFEFSKSSRSINSKPIVEFRFIEKQNPKKLLMSSRLKLNAYHKDILYRQNVILNKMKVSDEYELNNLGTSVITLSLIVKSCNNVTQDLNRIEEQDLKNVDYMEKYLDYDLSVDNNQVVKAMNKMDKKFKKIMDPLDQLDNQKYLQLKIATSFTSKQANWIRNSQVTIEELKAIFSFVFSEESEKSIRLNFPKFYEDYASNYQKFDLGIFLLQLILMTQMPKSKKLSMLFCIGVHYQGNHNSSQSQQMSIQTLNSLVNQIMKSTGFLNACPFTNRFMGEIIYACYYEKGSKVEQNKCEITNILQDWAYICQLKSQYNGIVLGSVDDLSILRAMMPQHVLRKMEMEEFCRFQVHYRIKEDIFVWSATVNTADFTISKRGVKFLNTFPRYYESDQILTSVAEVMLNTQNTIPLQQNSTVDYQQFIEIFKKSPLLDYLLRFNEQHTSTAGSNDKTHYYLYQIQKYQQASNQFNQSQIQPKIIVSQPKQEFYTDFALLRYQNCIPSWRSCKVIEDEGKARAVVEFKDKQGTYLVPRFQIICLDEVQVANKVIAGSQISQSQFSVQGNQRR